tara:strand:+ start:563 stop:805 length:243 start_codon:yes stop_codon:yes gene_type:complete
MLINIIYVLISLILIFILYIAIKGISRGVEAKKNLKKNSKSIISTKKKLLSKEILNLKKMHEDKIINKKEFEKAKKKLLS